MFTEVLIDVPGENWIGALVSSMFGMNTELMLPRLASSLVRKLTRKDLRTDSLCLCP